MQFDIKNYKTPFFQYVIGLCAVAMLLVIGVYSYLGTYSRYMSDDYCEAVRVTASSPIQAVVERYSAGDWRAANRYSNLLFVGFSELLGRNNMQITMSSMVIIWAIGLSWSIREFRKLLGIHWDYPMDLFLGTALEVFCLLQIPSLFQTIYWRSSMMTHFAPLVFGSFLFAFWMRQARLALSQNPSWPVYPFLFFSTFMIAGFSEPPVATMVTGLFLCMLAAWLWAPPPFKQRILALLAWTFAGAFLGLMVMVFSPANAQIMRGVTPGAVKIISNSFLFSYFFISDSIRTFPLPSLLSMLMLVLIVWLYRQLGGVELSRTQKRILWIIVFSAPIIMWILIAAGFSPSVYGQGFPVARMRFLARTIVTATIMLEGAMIGLLVQDLQFKPSRNLGQLMAAVLIVMIGIIYPVRAAINIYRDNYAEYSDRAQAWDAREAQIHLLVAEGRTDLIIPQLDGVDGVKELDVYAEHWVNRCAAQYYGVNSIKAITVK